MAVFGCGGGATATPATTSGQPASAIPSVGGAPVPPPAGGESASVTLTGGDDAGSYTASGEPNCTNGLLGTGTWGVQFSLAEAAADQLSSVQLVYRSDGTGGGDDDMFGGVSTLFTVAFGSLMEPEYRDYEVEVRTDGEESSGTGTVTVTDNGSTAVIHAVGTTAEGVGIDATVNCPSVMRM
ncbi:MAG TPA: hypothetical protein VMZ33_01225 [Candidatus Limnocylindrales bacterium]|nr:hypothetical protein [Candidatus Limnocylindrales bacterium]